MKVLKRDFSHQNEEESLMLISSFETEARSTFNIEHENLITVYDYGLHETTPYILME